MAQKVGTQGGKGGNSWDDGSDHDGVTKIQVAAGWDGIQYVKFDYVKNGEVKEGQLRGLKGTTSAAEPFVINHPEEYLVCVEGWYSPDGLIQGLNFISNKKTSDLIGVENGAPFKLQVENKKIIGFHGFAGDSLNSLGAYFAPLTNSTPLVAAKKLEPKGAKAGAMWDDGAHDGVKKVYVGKGQEGTIAFLKFEYHKESQKVVGDEHGKKTDLKAEEFEVDADDYIVYAEGYYDKASGASNEMIITSIRFRTYKGKTSKLFGTSSGTKFVLQGGKIVGFHGHATDVLHSLGAYITLQSTQNLQGKWLKMEQKGTAPGLRCSHAIAAVGDKIYSFGGEFTANQPIDKDLYVYDTKTKTWSITPATGDVPHLACLGVRMVSIGTTLYVFGGRDASRKYNGFYSYDTIKNEWKLVTPLEEGPTPRSFHSMAADDKNVYVFGGVSATSTRVKTLDFYNVVDKKWVQLPTPGDAFNVRGGAGLEVVNGEVWVVYGFTGYELDDIYYFDVAENMWLQVETTGQKPCGRSVFASAVVGKYIIVFGGEVEMDPLAHVGPGHLIDGTFALDTETLKWERLDKPEEEGPSPRGWTASTTATIDGKKGLVMLGGKAQNNERFEDLYFYEVESV